MSEKPKIPPRSHAQTDIIQFLIENKTMTFTELQNKLKISRPALSRHLSALLEDKTLVFTKEGREKHYKFGPNASKIPERQIDHFSFNYMFDAYDDLHGSELELKKMIEEFGKKTNAFFMFSFLKSIETGKDWTKAVHVESLLRGFIEISMPRILNKEELPEDISEKSAFSDMGEELLFIADKYFKKNKKPLKEFHKILEKMFPDEIKILDKYSKD